MDIDDVAAELYSLAPEEFTGARKAKVNEARRGGDRQLSAAIGELRRPTATASIVNLLARSRPDLIDDLLALGEDMRQAQASLAGEDLRRLSARRHEVVSELVDEGRRLAAEQGRPVSPQVESELSATLQAALADPDAAEAVRSGQLTAALHYSGFGLADGAGGAPAQPRTARPEQPTRSWPAANAPSKPGEPSGPGGPSKASEPRREAIAAATETLDAARSRLEEVGQAAAAAEEAASTARQHRQEAAERISDLEHQLTQAREGEREAAKQVRAAEKDWDRAARTLEAARRRVEQAQQSLDRRKST